MFPAPAGVFARRSLTAARLMAYLEAEADHGHLFLFVPVALATGAAYHLSTSQPFHLLPLLAGLCLALAALVHLRGRGDLAWRVPAAAALVAGGMLLAEAETQRCQTVVLDSPVTTHIRGIVDAREVDSSGVWRYRIHLLDTAQPTLRRPPETVQLVARSRHDPVDIGAPIAGHARLSPPSGPALPRLHDFAFPSYFDGLGAIGYFLGSPAHIAPEAAVLPDDPGLSGRLERRLVALRSAITGRIRAVLPGDAGGFAAAIITGERRGLSDETTEQLRVSGLAHIISISGLHMALAAGLFFVGLRILLSLSPTIAQRWPTKKVAAAGALIAALIYLLISGAQVSATRAFIMTAVMLVAVMTDRPAISLRNLALAAIVVVIVWPHEVLGPSFQMSFAATAALIAGYAALRGRSRRDGVLPAGIVPGPVGAMATVIGAIALSSTIGGLSTAMFAAEHFHRVSLYGLPANLGAMPIVSFIVMPAGLVAMVLMPFGLDWLPLKVMGLGLDLVIRIAATVAGWGGNGGVERLPGWFLPLAVCGFVLLTLLRTRLRHLGTGLIALALLGLIALPRQAPGDILIAETGDLVAFTGPAGLATNRTRPPSFLFAQWQEALERNAHMAPDRLEGSDTHAGLMAALADRETPLPAVRALALPVVVGLAAAARQTRGRFVCFGKDFCLGQSASRDGGRGLLVATIEDPRLIGLACDHADMVVTPRHLRFDTCRSGARLIHGQTLRITGALEITPDTARPAHLQIRSAFAGAARAWQRHRRYDWRSGTYRPAPVEATLARLSDSGG
ncbi:ComEC/Rec2 family competence protein [Rhizobium halophytocola]|uniref:ComEC/Rec2-related protein n=1 Tax=Rhizobium halophytocola TaxID=735519 RepID=A0ABS4DWH0_9HYPH|nr:ComEC/Rec2 family competence protein [Rhizobium halophytocola]MBP1850015.1 ComEC/Rec2-related protein [Rhizobium halophytocola]